MSLEGKSQDEVASLAALSNALLADPKTRTAFQRLVKTVNPKLSLPEVELEDRVAAAIKPVADKNAALEADLAQRKQIDAANALFEGLRDSGVVSSRADFTELVKFAAKEGFQTNDAGLKLASAHRKASTTPATPTPSNMGLDNLRPGEADKSIMKNPITWARDTARAAVDELMKTRRAG